MVTPLLSMAGRHSAAANNLPQASNLQAYLRLDANANDFSGKGNNFTAGTNVVFTSAGRNNNAASGFGTNGILARTGIVVNTPLSIYSSGTTPKPFSFSLWFYPTTVAGAQSILILNDANGFYPFHFCFDSGLKLYGNSGNSTTRNFPAVSANTWHHVVFSVNGTSVKSSVNGEPVVTSTHDYGSQTQTKIQLGSAYTTALVPFSGRIDEFAWWDVALTDAEMAQMWNSGNGLFL